MATATEKFIESAKCGANEVVIKLKGEPAKGFPLASVGKCNEIHVSSDNLAAGWFITKDLIIEDEKGKEFDRYKDADQVLYVFFWDQKTPSKVSLSDYGPILWSWDFYKDSNKVSISYGSTHGKQVHTLYDLRKKQAVKTCSEEDVDGLSCPTW